MIEKDQRMISFVQIRKASLVYIALPLFCFLCGSLRWYYSVILSAVLVFIMWKTLSTSENNLENKYKDQFCVPAKTILFIFFFSLIWSYLGGMNGFFYQSTDWDCRNAIYFDLIQYDWPVIYEKNGAALVYYIGHWLPPAIVAKFFRTLAGSVEIGRLAGRMLLWIWSSIGLTIIILMIYRVVGAQTRKRRIAATFIFAFFSGMDIIGAILRHRLGFLLEPGQLHLEWWIPGLQYSSMTTCVFWVFNQTIVPWMITLCFISEKDPRNYIFLETSCLLCGTLPCVGLALLMLVKTIVYTVNKWRAGEGSHVVKKILSIQNILTLFFLFPIVAAFILSANTVNNAFAANNTVPIQEIVYEGEKQIHADNIGFSENAEGAVSEDESTNRGFFFVNYSAFGFFVFVCLEVGIFMLCVWFDHKKDPLFYTIGICFFLFPFIHIGRSHDFCMRASIPCLFILMLYVNQFLLKHFQLRKNKRYDKKHRRVLLVLVSCFVIGMFTPAVELYRGIYHVVHQKTIFLEDRSIMTFNQEEIIDNFMCSNPGDYLFFKYIAR